MSHEHPILATCETLAVSRSGYDQWLSASDSVRVIQAKTIKVKIAKVAAFRSASLKNF
jgi:hypothetical protein